jgi:hypothetical protein
MIGAVKIQVKPEEIIEAVKPSRSDISGVPQRYSGGTG